MDNLLSAHEGCTSRGGHSAPESAADVNGEPDDMASKPTPRKRAKAVKKRPSSPPLMVIMPDCTLRPLKHVSIERIVEAVRAARARKKAG